MLVPSHAAARSIGHPLIRAGAVVVALVAIAAVVARPEASHGATGGSAMTSTTAVQLAASTAAAKAVAPVQAGLTKTLPVVADGALNAASRRHLGLKSSARAAGSRSTVYVRFHTAGLPSDRRLVSATLVLAERSATGSHPTLVVRSAATSWTESGLSRARVPSVGSATLGSVHAHRGTGTLRVHVSISSIRVGGYTSYALRTLTSATSVLLGTRESGAGARLVLGYANPLPFTMPSPATLRASSHLVFAHYWPPLPRSLDNKNPASDYYAVNYLRPQGENGKHAAYGGHLRDRPIARGHRATSDWRLIDQETEVRQAVAAGLDGFSLDIMNTSDQSGSQVWKSTLLMMDAAHRADPHFKIMLMPDMSGLASRSVSQMAATLAVLGRKPAAFHLSDGRLVVSPFMTEAHAPAWWQQLMSTMSSTYGIRVALVPVFVDSEQNHAAAFKSISYGMGNWGSRNPAWNSPAVTYPTSPRGRIAKVRALGVKWMQPVSVQDERPRAGLFDEARNTDNLIDTWNVARLGHADWVQLTTWNDYTEGSQFAPSEKHGWTYLDISSYYLAWYKTGHAPKIRRNTVYVTHRTQFTSAKPSYPESLLMHLRGGSPARDDVQALTFLTHSAKVTITVGGVSHTCNVPAGVGRCLAPLRVGHVSVVVKRAGHTVTRVRSPYAVTANPYVQDLQYVGASSRRPKP